MVIIHVNKTPQKSQNRSHKTDHKNIIGNR